MPKRATRKKATSRKKPARPVEPAQEHVDAVVLLLATGLRDATLREAAITVGEVPDQIVDTVIAHARRKLQLAADYHRDEELGASIAQWRELFRLAVEQNDLAAACSARNRLDTLLGIKQPQSVEPKTPDGQTPEANAIRKHLFPLRLAQETKPLAEHVRLAALRIIDAEAPP